MNEIKLDPKCFKGFPMSVNNLGYLLPCCYCDESRNLDHPDFQKILSVSKLDDYETIEEIIFSKEWKEFEENLRNHKGPPSCLTACGIDENKTTVVRKDTWIDPGDGKIIHERTG